MTPRHVRTVRGAAAASAATIVAATAHTLAGGGAPAPLLVAGVGILASPFAVALIGRRLAAWRVAVTVLASQALFHLAFTLTAGADPAALAGHHAPMTGDAAGIVLPDTPMLVGHLLAAGATVVVLYGGERMLRALGRGIRSLFSRAHAGGPLPSVPRLITAPARVTPLTSRALLSDLSRRGPPALVPAAL